MLVRNVFIFGASALLMAGAALAQSQEQSQSSSQTTSQNSAQQSQAQDQKTTSTTATPSTTSQQTESLGEAARKARQENKNAHAAKTFTNDDLPAIRSAAPVSEVGQQGNTNAEEGKAGAATKPGDQTKDETYWRKRFADVRGKIAQKQQELDVSQRELNLLQREFYTDPNEGLKQANTREDINKKTDEIAAKQKELDDLNQQLSNLQDELRQAGGDPAWGR
jgi:chromosome segregation ATPase